MLFITTPKADIFKLKEKRLNINAKKIIIPIMYFLITCKNTQLC